MLSWRRRVALMVLPLFLLLTGTLSWMGNPNWWDEPYFSTSMATQSRIFHALLGLLMLVLVGTVYWHSKMRWHAASSMQKISGIALWVLLSCVVVGLLLLLYAENDWHFIGLIMHGGLGCLLLVILLIHLAQPRKVSV